MNKLCAAGIKTKVAGDKQETKIILESHELLQAHSNKVGITVGAREVRTTSRVMLDTDAGPYLITKEFIMTA